jgi:ribonucleoside-diphosphate reductase alpha chain
MSLKIGDRAAGAIKSGGTTRRAAKMVIVDIDHPDIEDFIEWKGSRSRRSPPGGGLQTGGKAPQGVLKACVNCEGSGGVLRSAEEPCPAPRNKAARKSISPTI